VTFVRPDQWVAGWRQAEGRRALAEVFRRFVAAYGPVSASDFAPWFGMQPAAATELARSLGDQVEEVDVEGYHGLLPAGEDVAGAGGLPGDGSVLLLPSFDCYVRGAYPRDRVIPPSSAARALEGAPTRTVSGRADLAGPLPVLLVDGVVVGIWERRRSGRRFDLRVEPFVRLGAGQRAAVQVQAARIGEILEAPVALSFGAIRRRPHL
jgi:Winged helix DNA-binding domain